MAKISETQLTWKHYFLTIIFIVGGISIFKPDKHAGKKDLDAKQAIIDDNRRQIEAAREAGRAEVMASINSEEEKDRIAHDNAIKQLETNRLNLKARQSAERDAYIKDHGIAKYYGDEFKDRPVESQSINFLRQQVVNAKLRGVTRDQALALVERISPPAHKPALSKIIVDVYGW